MNLYALTLPYLYAKIETIFVNYPLNLIFSPLLIISITSILFIYIPSSKILLAMSKTPHLQYLCGVARHGKPLYHYGFIETISSGWYN